MLYKPAFTPLKAGFSFGMNLADVRYLGVMAEDGGPIERIECAPETIDGRPYYSAYAWLRTDLGIGLVETPSFAVADGGGTHRRLKVARYMAVSECIERWAMRALRAQGSRSYGFAIDPTSNGMAAYPGLFAKNTRKFALNEAKERYYLQAWWQRRMAATRWNALPQGMHAIVIGPGTGQGCLAVVWRCVDNRYFIYGFSWGANSTQACFRASVEMERTGQVVGLHYRKRARLDRAYVDALEDVIDRRTVYFSTTEGHERFLSVVEASVDRDFPSVPAPYTLFDGEIPGPWKRFANVWRVVFKPLIEDVFSPRYDIFVW